MNQPGRPSTLGLLPLPEHRRNRLLPLMALGVVALGAGVVFDVGFVQGLGAGLLLTGAIALLLDRWSRRRQQG